MFKRDTAEDAAAASPFLWDISRHVYIWRSNGHVVTSARLGGWAEEAIGAARSNLRSIANGLLAGTINRAEWAIRSGTELRNLHRSMTMLAYGGKGQMNNSRWGRLGGILQRELNYFNRFASSVDNLSLAELGDRFLARVESYGVAGWTTYQGALRVQAIEAGDEERTELGGSIQSCGECIDQADMGWQPAGTLVPIGDRECGGFCNCSYLFRSAEEAEAEAEVA